MIELYEMIFLKAQFTRICSQTQLVFTSIFWQHQKSRIQRKLFFQSSPQDPHVACFVLLSGDESCPVRAKTHHSDFQNLVCSHPSRGRNQPSRPVSSGTLPTPHRLLFGHSTHRRHLCCRGRRNRHRFSDYQLCRVRHNSCEL